MASLDPRGASNEGARVIGSELQSKYSALHAGGAPTKNVDQKGRPNLSGQDEDFGLSSPEQGYDLAGNPLPAKTQAAPTAISPLPVRNGARPVQQGAPVPRNDFMANPVAANDGIQYDLAGNPLPSANKEIPPATLPPAPRNGAQSLPAIKPVVQDDMLVRLGGPDGSPQFDLSGNPLPPKIKDAPVPLGPMAPLAARNGSQPAKPALQDDMMLVKMGGGDGTVQFDLAGNPLPSKVKDAPQPLTPVPALPVRNGASPPMAVKPMVQDDLLVKMGGGGEAAQYDLAGNLLTPATKDAPPPAAPKQSGGPAVQDDLLMKMGDGSVQYDLSGNPLPVDAQPARNTAPHAAMPPGAHFAPSPGKDAGARKGKETATGDRANWWQRLTRAR